MIFLMLGRIYDIAFVYVRPSLSRVYAVMCVNDSLVYLVSKCK